MNNEEQKDYMGTISWSRLYCGAPQTLFGSEIKTSNPIVVRIDGAHIVRNGFCDESIFPANAPYIEVEMTPVQWAEFLTSGCSGEGVPCTITRRDGKAMSRVEPRTIAEVYERAVGERFDAFQSGIKNFESQLQELVDSGKGLTKGQTRELVRQLQIFRNNTVDNLSYVRERFGEDMAKVVAKARAEVNAYAERHLEGTGVVCLMGNAEEAIPRHLGESEEQPPQPI